MTVEVLRGYLAMKDFSNSTNQSSLALVFTNTGVSDIGGNRTCLATPMGP